MRSLSSTSARLALALILSACGGVSTSSDGAPGGDALTADGSSSADAEVFDAAPRIVTVTVYTEAGGVLSVGTPVVFHHADGTVQITKLTDATGTASELVEPGAAVTVVVRPWTVESPYPRLGSVLGLNGGEHLVFGQVTAYTKSSFLGTMVVTLPSSPVAGAGILTSAGCTSSYHDVGAPSTLTFYSNCPANLDFVTTLYDPSTNDVSYYTFTQGVPFGNGSTVAQPAWRNDFSTTTFNLSNIPAGVEGANLTSAAWSGGFSHNVEYRSLDLTGASSSSAALRMFNGFPNRRQHAIQLYGSGGNSAILWTGATAPATRAVNVTADFLPFVSGEAVTEGVVTFTRSGGTAAADLTSLQVSWNEEGGYGDWSLIAPAELVSIKLPELPTDLGSSVPSALATFYASAGQIEFDGWASYRDALDVIASGDAGGFPQGAPNGILKSSINQRD